MADRVVRFTEEFFERLDQLLPEKRSSSGTPSVTDFLLHDLPTVRDRLAEGYHDWTLPSDDPDVRVYIGAGLLVSRFAIFTTLDGETVSAIWLSIDSTNHDAGEGPRGG